MPSPAKVRPQRADNVIALPANTSLPQPHPAGKPHHHAHTPVPGYAGTLPRATAGFEFRLRHAGSLAGSKGQPGVWRGEAVGLGMGLEARGRDHILVSDGGLTAVRTCVSAARERR